MPFPTFPTPHLSNNGVESLRRQLNEAALDLRGCFLVVASAKEILFDGYSGRFDVLQGADSPPVNGNTIIWTTYLQLVDSGSISLDTPLSKFSPELAQISREVLTGFNDEGPTFEPAKGQITLRNMLNGTSGFAPEFDELSKKWKSWSEKGKGYINSCKIENLIHTPPCAQPGEHYAYGPSADWLSFIFPKVAGQELESYLQEKVFRPLGISSATYFPYDSDLAERVMPLSWLKDTVNGKAQFEEWTGQQAVHLRPKRRAEMEYPAGGSALYSTAREYARLLQNVLIGYTYQPASPSTPSDFVPLLSPQSYKRLLVPDLRASQTAGLAGMLNGYFDLSADDGDILIGEEDVNVGLGDLPIYVGEGRKGGWGRRPGSAGWGGAAGTDFYIDCLTGIVVFFSTQVLPGSGPVVKKLKKRMEKAVYEALEME